MIFPPTIINHLQPQIAVTTSDTSSATAPDNTSVSYQQIKQSFGQFVYNAEQLYLQSNSIQQLIGTIEYQRYDVTGNQTFSQIATVVDPNQTQSSLVVDLTKYNHLFILNGNSTFSAVVLPFSYVNLTIITSRVTNNFGQTINSFKTMEEVFRNPNFFTRYGNIEDIQQTNEIVKESATAKFTGFTGDEKEDQTSLGVLTLMAIIFASFYLIKNKYVIRKN